jgi:ADP-ribose pyrophosphatase YjhB (NUDIX family)
MKEDELVEIAHFESLAEAQAARGLLESTGLPAYVHEQDVLRMDPFRPLEAPSIRLSVLARDREAAEEVLASIAAADDAEEEGEG